MLPIRSLLALAYASLCLSVSATEDACQTAGGSITGGGTDSVQVQHTLAYCVRAAHSVTTRYSALEPIMPNSTRNAENLQAHMTNAQV
ncbi:hypothetical protein AC579_7069 [Pseudocercospora musae]|uniref:Uncharacterized protein n=1 Tax=Pseudocercospora musae TaxID=113226 RepID=A0A139H524_9PEZI|nr:hypothetical protein AC579_7069 [Pseudocercospora musae]